LVALYDSAATQQALVRRIGMDDIEIAFLLQDAHQSLIKARTLVHTFDPEKVKSKTTEGITKASEAINLAAKTVKDYYFRRMGFGVATFIITILVIALFFKIREIEKSDMVR